MNCKILRLREVKEITGLSRSTIYVTVRHASYPPFADTNFLCPGFSLRVQYGRITQEVSNYNAPGVL